MDEELKNEEIPNDDRETEFLEEDNTEDVKAITLEIRDDMPEEVKEQIRKMNAMSELINSDAPIADDEDENMTSYGDDDSDDNEDSDDSSVNNLSEDDNVEYSDIF